MIICPKCGSVAQVQQTKYAPRYHCCDLWAWGENPLVDAETHAARMEAHITFDPIWQGGYTSRTNAYDMLANYLDIPVEECHMKLMDKETARKVPGIVEQIVNIMGYDYAIQ